MAKSQHQIQQTSEKAKLLTYSHIGLLLASAMLVSMAACLVRTSCSGTNSGQNSVVITNPKWAQPL